MKLMFYNLYPDLVFQQGLGYISWIIFIVDITFLYKLYRQQRMQELPLQQVPAGQTVIQPGVVIMPPQAQGGQQRVYQPSAYPGQHVVQYPEQRPPPIYTPQPQ